MTKIGKKEKEMNWAGSDRWQCRVAPSLGTGFAGTPEEVWGTLPYDNQDDPTVFFGLYGLPDFYALWRHQGEKAILWAGSDIRHFVSGYWLDRIGDIRVDPYPLARWINKECRNYVENYTEAMELAKVGIQTSVIPSFLGDIKKFTVQELDPRPRYYTTVSGDDFELYGWNNIWWWAREFPEVEFHLYGNTKEYKTHYANVFEHGRVSQEQMDTETKSMTGALRLTKFDGFSEILAKSILWGQWPVSPYIQYEFMDKSIFPQKGNNLEGRDYYLGIINQYPWNYVKNN